MIREEKYMRAALREADKALAIDEVPIGCVIVKDDHIISRGFNRRETTNDPTAHAEIIAIRKASQKLKNWRLEDCELFVTIEPCIMCSGAIIQSRISRVYFGACDIKGGGLGTSIDVLKAQNINHHPLVTGQILEKDCADKIKKYFQKKREKKDE
ncbi:MAG: nucleoside deaminase [Erysipelotrichaceae bacterium]|nr:nucleoside deaminase [Erysipelotrichaceae bacterium]